MSTDTPTQTAPVKQGEILAGKYRVDRVLGAGGMGVVVAATHLDLLEPRALKFMLPEGLKDADMVERFVREARAAAKLKSEHVAKVHDVGRLENGAPYMVMEYLEGSDLDAIVKRQGPLSHDMAALVAIQACSALAEAHSLGIIHRDLKPSNLFLTHRPDGSPCVKVLDFGISKVLGASAEFEMTKTNTVMGSPHYMSPEQMRSARSVDVRTDVWSLGIILYKLITGKVPFTGQTITELITTVLEATAAPPSSVKPGIAPAFEAVIMRCIQRNRDERFANVAELAAALAPFAPPGVEAAIEPMFRVLGTAAGRAGSGMFSMPAATAAASATSAPASATSAPASATTSAVPATPTAPSPIAAPPADVLDISSEALTIPITAPLLAPPLRMMPPAPQLQLPKAPPLSAPLPPPAPLVPPIVGDRTTDSWGNTAPKLGPRSQVGLLVGGIVGMIVLIGVIAGLTLGRSASTAAVSSAEPAGPSATPIGVASATSPSVASAIAAIPSQAPSAASVPSTTPQPVATSTPRPASTGVQAGASAPADKPSTSKVPASDRVKPQKKDPFAE